MVHARKSPAPVCVLAALSGLLLATATLVAPLRAQTRGKTVPPEHVAETLNRLIQPRFRQFGLGFGVASRLIRVSGHNAVTLRVDTPAEKKILADANAADRAYVIAFLHCVHIPATAYQNARGQTVKTPSYDSSRGDRPDLRLVAGKQTTPGRSGPYQVFDKQKSDWQSVAQKRLPSLKRGKPENAESGAWFLAMRPVRAASKDCLSCHTNSKLGDTLGVMVYAISRNVGTKH